MELEADGKGNNSEPDISIKSDVQLVAQEPKLTQLFNSYFVCVASSIQEPTVCSDL